jgi:hypothetical protein
MRVSPNTDLVIPDAPCMIYLHIFTYILMIFRANVGKYSSTMEHLGMVIKFTSVLRHLQGPEDYRMIRNENHGQWPQELLACLQVHHKQWISTTATKLGILMIYSTTIWFLDRLHLFTNRIKTIWVSPCWPSLHWCRSEVVVIDPLPAMGCCDPLSSCKAWPWMTLNAMFFACVNICFGCLWSGQPTSGDFSSPLPHSFQFMDSVW